jgi:transcriptional regulator with GAF, ATPase, and Fis domain
MSETSSPDVVSLFKRLNACVELNDTADTLAESLCVLSGATNVGIYLRNYSGEVLVQHGSHPLTAPCGAAETEHIPDDDLEDPLCLCMHSARSEIFFLSAEAPASLRSLLGTSHAQIRELTAYPLRAPGGKIIGGVLTAFSQRNSKQTWESDAELLLFYGGALMDAQAEQRRNVHLIKELREDLGRVRPATQEAIKELTGNSKRLARVREIISRVAPTGAPVLITGETGTGKGLAARIIHEISGRGRRPFMEINCGALPSELLESELFGHVKGAFSGATAEHIGLFRSAHGGTIFLDEIGEMPATLQSSLLHVLQEHIVRPVGSTRKYPVDIRIIAATNSDLMKAMDLGHFRRDLYHRLAVVLLHMPSLQERREDIIPLAWLFMERFRQKYGRPDLALAQESLACLRQHAFKGNVRELSACIEQAVMLTPPEYRTIDPDVLFSGAGEIRSGEPSLNEQLSGFEAAILSDAHSRYGNNLQLCADRLGVHKKTLIRKLKRYALYKICQAGVKDECNARGTSDGTHV